MIELIDHEGDVQEIADRQTIKGIKAIVQVPKKEEHEENKVYEPEPCAYKIVTGDDEEFYTQIFPVVKEDGELFLTNAIQKCTAEVMILNTKLEQYYGVKVNDIHVQLNEGILLKRVPVHELTWFDTSEDIAKGILKDEELMYYQTVVPELMRKVSILESKLTPTDERPKRNDLRL